MSRNRENLADGWRSVPRDSPSVQGGYVPRANGTPPPPPNGGSGVRPPSASK